MLIKSANPSPMSWMKLALLGLLSAGLSGCATTHAPLEPVSNVDLQRFMGDWYVIANIPTFIEKGAHNAVESYALNDDGSVATTFSFNANGFDGERKTYHPTGYVRDTASNALWGMQFVWPFEADYRIVYLAPDYSVTIIGRTKRDYVWIMARAPEIDDDRFDALVARVERMGYDVSQLKRVPQRWN